MTIFRDLYPTEPPLADTQDVSNKQTGIVGRMIYRVVGEEGEYNDFRTWDVCCYTEKEQADLHCKAANKWVEDNVTRIRSLPHIERRKHINPYDKSNTNQIYYDTPNYLVEEDKMFFHFDQYQEENNL